VTGHLKTTLEEGMRNLKMGMTIILMLTIFVSPSWADVIGSRTRKSSQNNQKQVTERLHQLGIHPSEADKQVEQLSAKDLAFFAGNPQRVVLAGAQDQGAEFFSGSTTVMWYEIVGGATFTVLGLIIIWYAALGRD
jgi:hypothetical protein